MPEKIKWNGVIWEKCKNYNDYKSTHNKEHLFNAGNWYLTNHINDEIEIIEEQQDIDIQAIEDIKTEVADIPEDKYYGKLFIESCLQINKEKINQLIKAVKQLDRREER